MSVCSLKFPACNAHMPNYIIICDLPRSKSFVHVINGNTLEKKIILLKLVFWFSLQTLSETFLNLERNDRGTIKNVFGSHVKYPLFFSHLNTTWIFSTHFRTVGWHVAGFCKVMENNSGRRVATGDEIWIHHFAPTWKRSSMEMNYSWLIQEDKYVKWHYLLAEGWPS